MLSLDQFFQDRLDEIEAAALAAQASDPAPWRVDAHDDGSTWERNGHGAGVVIAADGVALWDCEGSNMLCMTAATVRHVVLHDPKRVLTEVAIHRRLLTEYQFARDQDLTGGPWPPTPKDVAELGGQIAAREMLRTVIYMLALAHSEHPDFEADWAPASLQPPQPEQPGEPT